VLQTEPRALPPPLPPHIRTYTDDELTLALKPFIYDYLARILAARERHGFSSAEALGAARLARFYAILCAACTEVVDRYRRDGQL
jgi:hypothetical protein